MRHLNTLNQRKKTSGQHDRGTEKQFEGYFSRRGILKSGSKEVKICEMCSTGYPGRPESRYCSTECYARARRGIARPDVSLALKGRPKPVGFAAKVSAATTGKPKPWIRGSKNPNYQNRAQSAHRAKFLECVKRRGQPWGDKERRAHSERMKGSANWMRGRRHSESTKLSVSKSKRQQYADGLIAIPLTFISKPEKQIAQWLDSGGIPFVAQFRIKGVGFVYDFYIPSANLLLEFQGDY